ncbi:MAG: methyltransferase domain-containing protein [Candidatus Hermodarchaeota archaeon]
MLSRARAWSELKSMVGLRYLRYKKHADAYYKGNMLRILRFEGWFDYLKEERTVEEIANRYHYTDLTLLSEILNILTKDGILQTKAGKYQNGFNLTEGLLLADSYLEEGQQSLYLSETLLDIYSRYAEAIPLRLRGRYIHSLAGVNLFNWDDALTKTNFETLWRCAFSFAQPLDRPGRFLHAGCYNGYITAAIWVSCLERGFFDDPSNPMEIIGIHHDLDILQIAKEEFNHLVIEFCQNNQRNEAEITEKMQSYEDYFPTFFHNSVENIKLESNSLDRVYVSQILQWVNTEQALREIVRVTKPGGMIFGDQTFLGIINEYNNLLYRVIEGATGHVTKQEFLAYLERAGVESKQVAISTPASVFKIIK